MKPKTKEAMASFPKTRFYFAGHSLAIEMFLVSLNENLRRQDVIREITIGATATAGGYNRIRRQS